MHYIVKFNDQKSLHDWLKALERPEYSNIRAEPSPILPDVILYDVNEEQVSRLRDLAQKRARFIPDFAHDLF